MSLLGQVMSDYGQRDYQRSIKCTCNQTLMLNVQFRYFGNSWAVRAEHKNSLRCIFCSVRNFALLCIAGNIFCTVRKYNWDGEEKYFARWKNIFCTVRNFAVHCRLHELSFSIEVAAVYLSKSTKITTNTEQWQCCPGQSLKICVLIYEHGFKKFHKIMFLGAIWQMRSTTATTVQVMPTLFYQVWKNGTIYTRNQKFHF